jgi:hypothetical protein
MLTALSGSRCHWQIERFTITIVEVHTILGYEQLAQSFPRLPILIVPMKRRWIGMDQTN